MRDMSLAVDRDGAHTVEAVTPILRATQGSGPRHPPCSYARRGRSRGRCDRLVASHGRDGLLIPWRPLAVLRAKSGRAVR